jgi:BioD-like phosphotransacetylase family protein
MNATTKQKFIDTAGLGSESIALDQALFILSISEETMKLIVEADGPFCLNARIHAENKIRTMKSLVRNYLSLNSIASLTNEQSKPSQRLLEATNTTNH